MANDESPVDAANQASPADKTPRRRRQAESSPTPKRATRSRASNNPRSEVKTPPIETPFIPPVATEETMAPRRRGRPRKTAAAPTESATPLAPAAEIADTGTIPPSPAAEPRLRRPYTRRKNTE